MWENRYYDSGPRHQVPYQSLLLNPGLDIRFRIAGPVDINTGPIGIVRLWYENDKAPGTDYRNTFAWRFGAGVTLKKFRVYSGYQHAVVLDEEKMTSFYFHYFHVPFYLGVQYYFK